MHWWQQYNYLRSFKSEIIRLFCSITLSSFFSSALLDPVLFTPVVFLSNEPTKKIIELINKKTKPNTMNIGSICIIASM